MRETAGRLLEASRRAIADCRVGHGPLGRLQVLVAGFLLPVTTRLPYLRDLNIPLRVDVGGRRTRFWIGDRSELLALSDIALGGEYAGASPQAKTVILDLGANAGAATLYFANRYPGARIVALEPDPSTFRRLERNVGEVAGVEVLPYAVGDRSGRALFRQQPRSWASHLVSSDDGGDAVDVEVMSLDDLLAHLDIQRVDLLKIDIEGAEFGAFNACTRLAHIAEIVGELHPDHPNAPDDLRAWLQAIAERAGHDHVECAPGGNTFTMRRLPT